VRVEVELRDLDWLPVTISVGVEEEIVVGRSPEKPLIRPKISIDKVRHGPCEKVDKSLGRTLKRIESTFSRLEPPTTEFYSHCWTDRFAPTDALMNR
jgi:hypothetical protein